MKSAPSSGCRLWHAKLSQAVPLCRFLGTAMPDSPFPRKNEGASEMAGQIVRFIAKNPLAAAGFTTYRHVGPLDFDKV